MKYMGSKRWMLRNGLGHLIAEKALHANRFVDLFCGSGAVSHYAARVAPVQVVAYDLQSFCAVLADCVIARNTPLCDREGVMKCWIARAACYLQARHRNRQAEEALPTYKSFTRAFVGQVRNECAAIPGFRITEAYGGHYFARRQALWIDALRATLPEEPDARRVALAALIQGAMQSVAGPGHTAQPFQPTRGAKEFLYEAWSRNVVQETEKAFSALAVQYGLSKGAAAVADANLVAESLQDGDLVFIDPPYSGVHYSRFYHVLETIAKGNCTLVTGVGRYPPALERPRSRYSLKTQSAKALDELLGTIARRNASALLTFPHHNCSNGLDGDAVEATARQYFIVEKRLVENRFSTLGGTLSDEDVGNGRAARQNAKEIIFILEPR